MTVMLHPAAAHTPQSVAAVESATGRRAQFNRAGRVELILTAARGADRAPRHRAQAALGFLLGAVALAAWCVVFFLLWGMQ